MGGCSSNALVEGQSGMDLAWSVFLVLELEDELIRRIFAFLEREPAAQQAGIDG
jgi:hypothetical protein